MTNSPQPPLSVLDRDRFCLTGLHWTPVLGGFSGAAVWRGDMADQPLFALKAWPLDITAPRLREIHGWMAQAAHVSFVPGVIATTDGCSVVVEDGRVWDVTRWMPGTPRTAATVSDVETACEAVARLHAAWAPIKLGPCPGVLNRLRVLADWMTTPELQPHDPPSLLERADAVVRRHAPAVARSLLPWSQANLPLGPCIRDLRGEHVLYTGNAVTGLVDYGAMALDHPAVDLARLLGDLAGENVERFSGGLRAYRRAGGMLAMPDELVRVLDRSGAVCSVIGWLVRLLIQQRTFGDRTAIMARLTELIARVENFPHI